MKTRTMELLEKRKRFEAEQKKVSRETSKKEKKFIGELLDVSIPRPEGAPQGKGTIRNSQPFMFGEGLGNNLGLDPPKYDTGWKAVRPKDDELKDMLREEEERQEKKKAAVAKGKKTRALNQERKSRLNAKLSAGELLDGQRIFLVSIPKDNFEERMRAAGYSLPEGLDVARTDFGMILLVPVVEADEAKAEGFTGSGFRDTDGRVFWIRSQVREILEFAFGRIQWRPLRQEELTQFGVKLQG
jgi:hypothetical protein